MEIKCFFCGRDLSNAVTVNYVAEGPICSICLMSKEEPKERDPDLDDYDQVILE